MTGRTKHFLSTLAVFAGFVGSGASAALPGYSPPPLAGSYKPAAALAHPYVFSSKEALQKLLADQSPAAVGSLKSLQSRVQGYVAHPAQYAVPYAGCVLNSYLYQATFEGSAIAGAAHPGAFPVAADLAMYAYLTSLHANYGDPALADRAMQLAKTILLKWAAEGFRENGVVRTKGEQFCDANNRPGAETTMAVGLQIGRGMPRWVEAQDLLMGLNAFNATEKASLDQFLGSIYQLIETTGNDRAKASGLDCVRFNNQVSAQLMGLAAIARLRDRPADLKSVATGEGGRLEIPWTLQVEQTIYGANPRLASCFGPNADKHVFSQISTVSPGEVMDRYREKPHMMFAYTLGSLEDLLLTAKILQNSGFGADAFVGKEGQSLLSSLHYYSYYFLHFAEDKDTTVPTGNDPYPSYRQYAGQDLSRGDGLTVSGSDGLLNPFLLGNQAFPNDPQIKAVLSHIVHLKSSVVPLSDVSSLLLDSLASLPN